jgi:hypothetical protein
MKRHRRLMAPNPLVVTLLIMCHVRKRRRVFAIHRRMWYW